MYTASCGTHLHFAHHVRGHSGPCISLHGHTWRFEIMLGAEALDAEGFVVDFDRVHAELFDPCFRLLDHSLALGELSFSETRGELEKLGTTLVASRLETLGNLGCRPDGLDQDLGGATNAWPGGIKIAVFPFTPTSERLAGWLFRVASERFANERVKVLRARVYESLLPNESFADYSA